MKVETINYKRGEKNMPYAYKKSILHLDLSSKKYWIEHPEEYFYRTYWGGRALAFIIC